MKPLVPFITFIIMLLMAASVHASYISMATEFSVQETDSRHILSLSTQNQGDEPAYAVQFEAAVGNQRLTSPAAQSLQVGERHAWQIELSSVFTLPGHYPMVITTHYQDANSYPFSALTVGFYDFQQPAIADIAIRAEELDIPVNRNKKLSFTIRNNGNTAHSVSMQLHVPKELAVNENTRTLTLNPGEERTADFDVKSFSALEKSNYAVFLVAEYQEQGTHYSAAGSTLVHITKEAFFSVPSWLIILVVAALILVFIVLQFRKK